MAVEKREFKVVSSNGANMLAGVVFLPDTEVKGYFHVVHGMTEYIGRYERFMSDMAENGYICFGYDNLGHGKTVISESDLGFIAKKRGWEHLAKDVKVFSDEVKKAYPAEGKKLPYYLMGHSMGSFIVRLAAERFADPDALIVMGTGGSNPAAGVGIFLTELVKLFRGERHISKLVNKLAFGNYNKRFADDGAPNPWLSTNTEARKKYSQDKYCNFKFTVSAMGDLIRLTKYSNSGRWYKGIAKRNIPVLLISGEEDPVGNYGKGVLEVYEKLCKRKVDVYITLFEGARHEILNDFTYEGVKEQIIKFCEK